MDEQDCDDFEEWMQIVVRNNRRRTEAIGEQPELGE